jgi:DDE superfamily endonuclease
MPTWTFPPSVAGLLAGFAPGFTAGDLPDLHRAGLRVPGPDRTAHPHREAAGARLSRVWSHDRAHGFFARARWSADQLGLGLVDLLARVLLDQDAPLGVVVDDPLMRRSGGKVFGGSWHHDPLATGRRRVAWGNNWVVLGVLVALPVVPSGRCGCRCWPTCGAQAHRHPAGAGVELVRLLAERHPDRRVHLVGDAA